MKAEIYINYKNSRNFLSVPQNPGNLLKSCAVKNFLVGTKLINLLLQLFSKPAVLSVDANVFVTSFFNLAIF
jgi:hypothetical protein